MRYVTNYKKETTCERCGRGITFAVVFLNDENVRIETGIDCAATIMRSKKNVLARIKSEREAIESAARFFENERPVLFGMDETKYVFIPTTQDSYLNRANRRSFSIEFIKANFPTYA